VPDNRGTPSSVGEEHKSPDGAYYVDAYRPRIEGLFARIERWTRIDNGITHWRSFSPDNVLTIYGGNPKARIADPDDPTKIFQWLISESFDDKGSAVVYRYKLEDGIGVDTGKASESHRFSLNTPVNTYLEQVQYCNAKTIDRQTILTAIDKSIAVETISEGTTPESHWSESKIWHMELRFDYHAESSDPLPANLNKLNKDWDVRPDPISSYNAGFEQRTYRRCKRALMLHHFPGGTDANGNHISLGKDQWGNAVTSYLVRSTNLTYDESYSKAENHIASYLTSASQHAYEKDQTDNSKYQTRQYPPTEFTYSRVILPHQVDTTKAPSLNNKKLREHCVWKIFLLIVLLKSTVYQFSPNNS